MHLCFVVGALGALGACAAGSDTAIDSTEPSDERSRPISSDDSGTGTTSTRDGSSSDESPPSPSGDSGSTNPPTPTNGKKRAFVTSTKYFGNLGGGGLGADSKCQKSATIALLGGTWKAWISDEANDAVYRIVDVGPWYTVDGKTLLYADVFALINGGVNNNSWLDELGNSTVEQMQVWTGTENGMRTSDTCDNWSSNHYWGTATRLDYADYTSDWSCDDIQLRLLCLEQ